MSNDAAGPDTPAPVRNTMLLTLALIGALSLGAVGGARWERQRMVDIEQAVSAAVADYRVDTQLAEDLRLAGLAEPLPCAVNADTAATDGIVR